MIKVLQKKFLEDTNRAVFKRFIEYIRFPFYKNFEPNIKLDFTFPITFLVGQNGTGKSSLLQALYGAPEGKSLGDFWFTTKIDPIQETDGNRNCLIYSYKTEYTKQQIEVLKNRAKRDNNLDYWEPARPKVTLNMPKFTYGDPREASKTRWNLLKKEVLYLDFRYEISAFDKYFYFGSKPSSSTMKTKQDYIRKQSHIIKKSYSKNEAVNYYNRKCNKPVLLTKLELETISNILGKTYVEGQILTHNLYARSQEGFSIILKTGFSEYSEAFAGSGESAIVKLVHEITNAPQYALVLLDEPETSLHPGAQQGLMNFLIQQTLKKQLQVVISTHSSNIIASMPKEAIKVLNTNKFTGKTELIQDILPEESFFYIGEGYSEKYTIIVEDEIAQILLISVLKSMSEATAELFEVKFYPGGASTINTRLISVYSQDWETTKNYVIFDGDQRTTHINTMDLKTSDKTAVNLEKIILAQINVKMKFYTDNNREDQKIKQMLDFLDYYFNNVAYLPLMIPEEIVWSEDVLDQLVSKEEKHQILLETDMKTRYAMISQITLGDSNKQSIQNTFKFFLQKWIKLNNDDYTFIVKIFDSIKNKTPI